MQTTAGNTLIGVVKSSAGVTVTGVTDTQGNTWAIDSQTPGGGPHLTIIRAYLRLALGASDSVTASFSASINGLNIILGEYYGQYAPDVTYGEFQNVSTSVTATAAAATRYAGELVISSVATSGGLDQGQSFTVSASAPPMTLRAQGPGGTDYTRLPPDGLAAVALTPSASWSWGTSVGQAACCVASYQPFPSLLAAGAFFSLF